MFLSFVPRRQAPNRDGFTLIELLVVITILSILIAILLPSLKIVKREAESLRFKSNLRQLTMGALTYAHENDDYLPPSCYSFSPSTICQWSYFIAPYLDQQYPMNYQGNDALIRHSIFHDPADTTKRAYGSAMVGNFNVAAGFCFSPPATENQFAGRNLASIHCSSELYLFGPGFRASGWDNAGDGFGDNWGAAATQSIEVWRMGSQWTKEDVRQFYCRYGDFFSIAFVDGHVSAVPLDEVFQESMKNCSGISRFWDGSWKY